MTKMRKPAVVVLLCAALACTLCGGCGKKEAKEAAETAKEITKSAAGETSSLIPGKVEEKAAKASKTKKLEGVLVRFTGGEINVDSNGKDYTFDVSKARIKTAYMRSGDDILITYKGKLKGADTHVKKVEDLGNANEQKEEKEAVGTLVDISMNTITIRQNDGTELTFNSNNCQHEFKNGIREGNWIVVTYIGEIQGTDTQNVAVIKITDNDDNAVEQAQEEMEIQAVDETVYATAGVYVRKSYSTDSDIIGSLEKGQSVMRTGICGNGWSRIIYNGVDAYVYGDYLSATPPAQEAAPAKTDGTTPATPQQGDAPAPIQKLDATPITQQAEQPTATQQQAGTVAATAQPTEEPEATAQPTEEPEATVQPTEEPEATTQPTEEPEATAQPTDEPEATTQPTEEPEATTQPTEEPEATAQPTDEQGEEPTEAPQQQEATGTVVDVDMNTMTVDVDGQEYTLNISDAVHEYANGIQTGNSVLITYVGNLGDPDVIVLQVEDDDPNASAANAVYTGTLTDATMNTITIQTDDGAVMTFDKDDAVDNTNGLEIGIRVSVTADAAAVSSDENILPATRIDLAQ